MVDHDPVAALREAIDGAYSILLTGPEDPDGDSIGACLALAAVIHTLGEHRVDVAGIPGFRYDWLQGAAQMVPDAEVRPGYDLVIVLDGNRERLPAPVRRAFDAAPCRGLIDHHGTTSPEGYEVVLLDRAAASTCGMILGLMDRWGVPLSRALAEQLYVGVIYDTGCFRHSNTTPEVHRQAARLLEQGIDHNLITIRVLVERRRSGMLLQARVLDTAVFHGGGVVTGVVSQRVMRELGCTPGDVEGIVDAMLYVEGVEVAVLLVERGPQAVKLSLRSRGGVNVAEVARQLSASGGGHSKAAGVTLEATLERAQHLVPAALAEAVRRARAAA